MVAVVAGPLRLLLQVAIRCEVVPQREAAHIQAAKLLRRPPVAIQWAEREVANPLAACEAEAASKAGTLQAAVALAAAALAAVAAAVVLLRRVAAGGPIAQRRFRNDNSTSSLLER